MLILFSSYHCKACCQLVSLLEELKCEYREVDVETHSSLAAMYGVTSLPTLMLVSWDDCSDVLFKVEGFNKALIVSNLREHKWI